MSTARNTAVKLPEKSDAKRRDHLVEHAKRRREDSRERLVAAARVKMCAADYISVTIDDIVAEAGLSRVTFYRHFSGKADIVRELYRLEIQAGRMPILAIRHLEFRDRAVVRGWISSLFDVDRNNKRLHAVFAQAAAIEPSVRGFAHDRLALIIRSLGRAIPAFATDPDVPDQRQKWLEAWLLLFELLDQSNHAAANSGVAEDPLVVEILTDRFMRFVDAAEAPA